MLYFCQSHVLGTHRKMFYCTPYSLRLPHLTYITPFASSGSANTLDLWARKSSSRICQRNRGVTADRIFHYPPTSKQYTAAFNSPFSRSVGLIRGGPTVGLDR